MRTIVAAGPRTGTTVAWDPGGCPPTGVVLSGAATVEPLHANLAARRLDLDPTMFAHHTETPQVYWRERGALPWT